MLRSLAAVLIFSQSALFGRDESVAVEDWRFWTSCERHDPDTQTAAGAAGLPSRKMAIAIAVSVRQRM
jgi:hypothetical protein